MSNNINLSISRPTEIMIEAVPKKNEESEMFEIEEEILKTKL